MERDNEPTVLQVCYSNRGRRESRSNGRSTMVDDEKREFHDEPRI
jgi:hypothetical protein